MSSLHADNITKPIDPQTRDILCHPDTGEVHSADHAAQALYAAVDATSEHADVTQGIHAPTHKIASHGIFAKLVPGLQHLADRFHIGNFVMIRGTGEKFFESMPIYTRLGMHLLYYGGAQEALLQNKSVESILLDLTQKEGATFDDPASVKNIPSFIKTYSIQTDELRNPDLSSYKNFNEFFFRQLREDARPVQNEDDLFGFCSAADCRLTTYPTVDLARKFWVKGRNFTIPNLLGVATDSPQAQLFDNGSLAIFRLAPADYHRFHSPLDGEIGDYTTFPGQYYTVNPQAVNEPGFDVFTANHRSVLYMTHEATGSPIALVAIGAMLVGSIVWTNGAKKGAKVKKGEELGYFAYGGSTVIVVFPKGAIQFDEDLIKNSENKMETLMKVGYSLGTKPKA